jgi:transketolase
MSELDQLCINTIRFLAADAIQQANSGHPGLPLGAAPMAYTLWTRHLRHNPANPQWPDRDRFVLSAGHGSMLLYALLHLAGYDLPLSELQSFRQWGSKTPGHPEGHVTPGVEITTGPLGQGLSAAVGMAIAEAHLAARFNVPPEPGEGRPGHTIVDHYTYVLASDGDLMEGVAAEACALAGHLGLGKLIVLFDDNRISLAGSTALTFTEDVGQRFEAYGWHVQHVDDGNDLEAIDAALQAAKAETARPSLILVRTILGYGAPDKQDTFKVHGSPLGPEELLAAKENLRWPTEPAFLIPQEALAHLRQAVTQGKAREAEWQAAFERYAAAYSDLAAEFKRAMAGELPADWGADIPTFPADAKGPATRKASEAVLQALAPRLPELVGGSADLNPSTYTWLKGFGDFQSPQASPQGVQGKVGGEWGYGGRNLHFGVREHAMGAIANGMALHGGLIPYAATFLVFADYMRPPMRLIAMGEQRVIFVFTHDSIGLGEDGPTHQPVEQMMNLRAVPNLTVIRPSDANETAEAWRAAIRNTHGPTALIFSRQGLPVLDRSAYPAAGNLQRGAYVLWESSRGSPDVILIGTGSEVHIALEAGKKLAAEGVKVRVVAMPSWELFDQQPADYRESVLPPEVRARVAVEAGIKLGWEHYVGLDGVVIGMESFGASAPGPVLYEKFGITAENVVAQAKVLLQRKLLAGWQHHSASLGPYQAAVDAALAEMARDRVMARIWAHDYTVWKPAPTEIANRLGWLQAAGVMSGNVHRLEALAQAARADGYTHALLLGMGGSSLAPEVFRKTFGVKEGYLDLAVLDSTDPGAVLAYAEGLDMARTLFIVATKSGGTVETLSFFKFFYNRVADAVGADRAGQHFLAITDPGSKLAHLAERYRFRATFLNDPNIGGRFSALSYFGLVPAALVGVDVPQLLDRALEAMCSCESCVAAADNPGAWLGAILGELAKLGRDKVTFAISPAIASFGDWGEQLIAESTGKEGQGILPVVGEPLGPPTVYSNDRLFIYLRLDGDDTHDAAIQALEEAGHPVVRLRQHDLYGLGAGFFLWEMATAVAGHRLGINPFDQPNVEAAKVLARQMVAEYGEKGALPAGESAPLTGEALEQFLSQAQIGDYVALQAYVQPTAETDAALLALRTRLRDWFKLATTVGYGPRFLHSTGQLHKGDAGRGLFIQFTADDPRDVPIPDEAGEPDSSMTFGVLKMAQALGDRQALLDAGRRVIRFHLGTDVVGGLKKLTEAVT